MLICSGVSGVPLQKAAHKQEFITSTNSASATTPADARHRVIEDVVAVYAKSDDLFEKKISAVKFKQIHVPHWKKLGKISAKLKK